MSLQDKLAQAIKDRQVSNDAINAVICDLKQQIADSEVTYSMGDRFKTEVVTHLTLCCS
jgi:transcriptional regulator NrdR family protein